MVAQVLRPTSVMGELVVPASALVVFAHPDDAEYLAGGTVSRWSEAGSDITYAVVTKGDKGSDDPQATSLAVARVREVEQRAAASCLGVRDVTFMGYEDGVLEPTIALRRDLTRLIRALRPEALVTFDPTVRFLLDNYPNHPDHRATGDAAIDAVFPAARDRLTFPELLAEGLEPHVVRELWLFGTERPNYWVDIEDVLGRKLDAIAAHRSQARGEADAELVLQMARTSAEGTRLALAEQFRRIVLE